MGTWGTGLFSDEISRDVRDDYKQLLGEGLTEPETTRRLMEEWKSEIADAHIAAIFWLALADLQWDMGRLQDHVKREALEVIRTSASLAKLSDDKNIEQKRKEALDGLALKLKSPQPPVRKVKKRYTKAADWKLGDVYSLRLRSGRLALLHVIGFHYDRGAMAPVCEILDRVDFDPPEGKTLEEMGYKVAGASHQHCSQLLLSPQDLKDFEIDRLKLETQGLKPKQKLGAYSPVPWRSVDARLGQMFELD